MTDDPRERDKLTRMLGWTSVGLGIPLLLAPAGSAKAIGVGDGSSQQAAVAGAGARELMAAAGLLWQRSPVWLWARVAGDLMDLALLGRALNDHVLRDRIPKTALKIAVRSQERKALGAAVAATAAVAGITILDAYAAASRSRRPRGETTLGLTATVTVTRPRQEVYAHWRRLEGLPDFMAHLDDVTETGPRTSRWRASAPFGKTVRWDAQITDDVPGERIAWRSLDGSAVRSEGDVRFTPAPRQNNGERDIEVHVKLRYSMPGGKLADALARYFGENPHQQLDDDLRRFKQVLETGEVVRSEGAPGGKRARREFPQHPARPLSARELAKVRS